MSTSGSETGELLPLPERLRRLADADEYASSHYDKQHYPLLREAADVIVALTRAQPQAGEEITVPLCEAFNIIGIHIVESDLKKFEAALYERGLNVAHRAAPPAGSSPGKEDRRPLGIQDDHWRRK